MRQFLPLWKVVLGALIIALTANHASAFRARTTDSTPGMVRIASDPPGASVELDNLNVGVTPLTIGNVRPGSHTIRLNKDNYAESQRRIFVHPHSTTDLGTIRLVSTLTGFLWVGSIPPGATVFLGEVGRRDRNLTERGRSSLFIGGLKVGKRYRVKVHREGFQDKIQEYTQGQGGMALFVTLNPVTWWSR